MSKSVIEQYRNALVGMLSDSMTSEDIGRVISAVDILSERYDVVEKETAITTIDDATRSIALLYLQCSKQEGKSDRTIANYSQMLRLFCDTVTGKSLNDINMMDIRRFLLSYQMTGSRCAHTVDHMRVVLSGFFGWLYRNEYIAKDPCANIEKIKYEQKTRNSLNGEEVARMRSVCKDDRERVILEVLVGSGLRVSELSSLKISDIDFRKKSMSILGKGNKRRIAYLSSDAFVAVERYVPQNARRDRNLIVSNDKNESGLSSRSIQRIIKDIAIRAGMSEKSVTPHVLRHTFATSLVYRGANLTSVQALLGHSSINTTMIYTHISDETVLNDYKMHTA